MPSIRQLEYLIAIAETKHFRRAAERVGVSQPTLSAQLRVLEERLQAQLVERSRSGTLLTPTGQEIAQVARRILRDVREIRDIASGQSGQFNGVIRIGLPPTIGPYLLPRLLPKMHKTYPSLQLYVREEVPQNLPASLQEGRYDVVVMPVPVRAADLESVALFREPLYLVVPTDSTLARNGEVGRPDLRDQAILTLESGHQLREQVEAICEEFGARLMSDFEGTSLDTLRQMVGMGMGLSFLPGLYVHTSLTKDSSVKALRLKDRDLHRTIGIVWRRTSARGDEFARLGEHIRATVKRSFPEFPLL